MIQEIAERTQNLWRPSPGSVYPTLQLLVDEGLIVATESEGSKKLFELTDDGRAAAEKIETPPWEEIAEGADPGHVNLRSAVGQLMGAVAQSAHTANAGAAGAHRRHRQQRPPRDLPDPRRVRVTRRIREPWSRSARLSAEFASLTWLTCRPFARAVHRRSRRLRRHAVARTRRVRAAARPRPGARVLKRAIELGVNHIDTAQFYGPDVANELIREALHPYPADLALVSKVGGGATTQGALAPGPATRRTARQHIEENLRTLGDRPARRRQPARVRGRRPQRPGRGETASCSTVS